MSSLANHPIYTLVFILLIIAYILINKRILGRKVRISQVSSMIEDETVRMIDIRNKERFNTFHITNSTHDRNPNNFQNYKHQGVRKIVLIYDSNIVLTMYQKIAKIDKFPEDVYLLYMPDYQVFASNGSGLRSLSTCNTAD